MFGWVLDFLGPNCDASPDRDFLCVCDFVWGNFLVIHWIWKPKFVMLLHPHLIFVSMNSSRVDFCWMFDMVWDFLGLKPYEPRREARQRSCYGGPDLWSSHYWVSVLGLWSCLTSFDNGCSRQEPRGLFLKNHLHLWFQLFVLPPARSPHVTRSFLFPVWGCIETGFLETTSSCVKVSKDVIIYFCCTNKDLPNCELGPTTWVCVPSYVSPLLVLRPSSSSSRVDLYQTEILGLPKTEKSLVDWTESPRWSFVWLSDITNEWWRPLAATLLPILLCAVWLQCWTSFRHSTGAFSNVWSLWMQQF